MQYDTALTRNELGQTCSAIEPTWEIIEATPVTAGHHAVYLLPLDTRDGTGEWYQLFDFEGETDSAANPLRAEVTSRLEKE